MLFFYSHLTEEHIQSLSELEKSVYTNSAFIAGPEVYLRWWKRCPEGFISVFDAISDSVIGAIITLPLTDVAYSKILNGDMIDSELKSDDILHMDAKGLHNLYIADVMIHPKCKKKLPVLLLLKRVFIKYISRKGILVRSICADVCSVPGERLCNYFDMTFIGKSLHGSKIYEKVLA